MSDEAWIERLFARLTASYGNTKMSTMWAGTTKADLLAAWGEALAATPTENVYQAVKNVATAHPSWPPTLGEFLALCQPPKPVPAAHRPLLADRRPRQPMPAHIKAEFDRYVAKAKV
jgi:hypothetical protein